MLEKEDIDAIVAAMKSGGSPPGGAPGGTEGTVQEDFAKVAEALDILANAVQEIKCELDAIKGEFGGFTSGLTGILDKRRRMEFVGGLREKFPDYARFEGIVKDLADIDLYDELGGELYDLRDNEEAMGTKSQELLTTLTSKFGPILEALAKSDEQNKEKPAGEKPVTAVEVEVTKKGVDPGLEKYLKKSKQ